MPATAALVVSAGESSRFGGPPTALKPLGGTTVVRRLVDVCVSRELDPVTVVVGPHRGPIAHDLRDRSVRLVDSEFWYVGPTASVQSGLEAIPGDRDVLFWPVDHPFVSPATVDALLQARDADAMAVWFIPTYEGQDGHPLLWRQNVRSAILDVRNDAPLRSLIPEFGVQVRRVPVDDSGVVRNVDAAETPGVPLDAWDESAEP